MNLTTMNWLKTLNISESNGLKMLSIKVKLINRPIRGKAKALYVSILTFTHCHLEYRSGRTYEGDWDNDKRQGRGYERFVNDNVY